MQGIVDAQCSAKLMSETMSQDEHISYQCSIFIHY